MKEIGGYFGLEYFSGKEYHEGLVAVNSGRHALLYLLKARQIKKLYLPYFLCDSVSNLCDRYGFSYEYYKIDRNFMPVFDGKLEGGEYLYAVNFYGQLSNDRIRQLKERYGNIIVDNVHAFFQRPVPGIDTIYSCRKFFGVPDGGYLATDVILEEEIPLDVSKDRMKHILGRFEGCASAYHGDFRANDRAMAEQPLRRMSALTHNLLRAVDYETACRKRNENFALLHEMLGKYNPLQVSVPEGPYAYPFYCPKGMEVKKTLAQNKIYVATLWPNVLCLDGTIEKDYAENILPLPCDQRYGLEDMSTIAEMICRCMEEGSK